MARGELTAGQMFPATQSQKSGGVPEREPAVFKRGTASPRNCKAVREGDSEMGLGGGVRTAAGIKQID